MTLTLILILKIGGRNSGFPGDGTIHVLHQCRISIIILHVVVVVVVVVAACSIMCVFRAASIYHIISVRNNNRVE
jgi:hypothetical protein